MLRARLPATRPTTKDDVIPEQLASDSHEERKSSRRSLARRFCAMLFVFFSFLFLYELLQFRQLMVRNYQYQTNRSDSHLRSTSSGTALHTCPNWPRSRDTGIVTLANRSPVVSMTKSELQAQIPHMQPTRLGTTGNQVLRCRKDVSSTTTPCRGVVKIYSQHRVYHHVKRIYQKIEEDQRNKSELVFVYAPRMLYFDDATHTMVEEDLGPPMRLAKNKLPSDWEIQIRLLHCALLLQHSLLHRDWTDVNILISKGMRHFNGQP